jgi:hypothetical protein
VDFRTCLEAVAKINIPWPVGNQTPVVQACCRPILYIEWRHRLYLYQASINPSSLFCDPFLHSWRILNLFLVVTILWATQRTTPRGLRNSHFLQNSKLFIPLFPSRSFLPGCINYIIVSSWIVPLQWFDHQRKSAVGLCGRKRVAIICYTTAKGHGTVLTRCVTVQFTLL